MGLLADAGSPVPAIAAEARRPSIILGDWMRTRVVGSACRDPEAICTATLMEARIGVVGTIAGPPVPSPFTVRFVAHVPPRQGDRQWLLVFPARRGQFWAGLWLWPTGAERGGEICVPTSEIETFGVAIPPGGRSRGHDVCYRY